MNDDNKQVQIHWINLKVQTIQRQICPYLFASEVPQYASGLPQTAPVGESEQEKISAVVVESFCWPVWSHGVNSEHNDKKIPFPGLSVCLTKYFT